VVLLRKSIPQNHNLKTAAELGVKWSRMQIIFDTREYLEKIWQLLEKVPLPDSPKNRYIAAMLFSAFDICDGMQLLIQKGNHSSSNILIRPLFEYVFRVFWLSRVASNEQILSSMKSDCWPNTSKLHKEIEGKNEIIDLLAKEKVKINTILHSYTHGGNQNPISHMGRGSYITPNIPDSDVIYFLRVVQISASFLLCELIHLSGSKDFESELNKIGEELLPFVSI
jgi:hypothetical protein